MILAFCLWLEHTPLGQFISGSTWAFPTIESIHVFFLVIVVGTVAIVDLRMLGVASRNRKVSQLSLEILPLTWGAFVGALITGLLMFSSKSSHYYANWPFRFKVLCLACAGLNMLLFHFLTYRDVDKWDDDPVSPRAARLAGFLSITFWIGVVAFGRWIGFTIR
jgi:hypothetical protein